MNDQNSDEVNNQDSIEETDATQARILLVEDDPALRHILRNVLEINDYFADEIDLILDAGKLPPSKGSTIVQVVNEKIQILRQGDLSEAEILGIING